MLSSHFFMLDGFAAQASKPSSSMDTTLPLAAGARKVLAKSVAADAELSFALGNALSRSALELQIGGLGVVLALRIGAPAGSGARTARAAELPRGASPAAPSLELSSRSRRAPAFRHHSPASLLHPLPLPLPPSTP